MDTELSAGPNCQMTVVSQSKSEQVVAKEEPSYPEAPHELLRERQSLKRLILDTNLSNTLHPGFSDRVGPAYNRVEYPENAKRVRIKKNSKPQSVPLVGAAKGFNTYLNHSPGGNFLPTVQNQRQFHGTGFLSPGPELIPGLPYSSKFNGTTMITTAANGQIVNNFAPHPFSPFAYPPVGISPQQNRLLSSGLLNYSLLSSRPGILAYSYLASLFDMNPSLDPKSRSHLESLIDISRYDQPELFHILGNTRDHSRQSSSHDVESTAGELGTAPGSPLYPAHLHWDLCQRPVSSPNFHKSEISNQLIPEPLYQNNGPYLSNSSDIQRSSLPISRSSYLPTSLIQNSFESNIGHENKNYAEKMLQNNNANHEDSIFPKLKPKPFSVETNLHNSTVDSGLDLMMPPSSTPKNSKKGSSTSMSTALPKHIQVPLITKSAWGCLYTVRKDGKPSTRATKMRLSEALTLIETQQVAAAFSSAGHPIPTICPYPRCEASYDSDFEFLRRHVLTHNPDRPFECSICNVAFQRDQDLSRHKNIHLQIKAFMCPHCKKNFGRRDAQQRHTLKKTCLPSSNPGEENDLENHPEPPADS